MIEKEQEDLHFILHDAPEPPRLLVIPKKTLARFTIALPLLLSTIILTLLMFAWFKSPSMTRDLGEIKLPSLPSVNKEDSRIHELESEIKALEVSMKASTAKLNGAPGVASEIWLGPLKRPYAMTDLTAKKMLRMEELTLESDSAHQVLRFNLVNTNPEHLKVMGHIFVLQLHAQGVGIYPAPKIEELGQGMRFDQGESFSVSRLRPVEAPFPPAPASRFLVLIFDRGGDLLVHEELSGPFKTAGGQ